MLADIVISIAALGKSFGNKCANRRPTTSQLTNRRTNQQTDCYRQSVSANFLFSIFLRNFFKKTFLQGIPGRG